MKKIFTLLAMALTFVVNANAENVTLWQSEDPAGQLAEWTNPCFVMSAEAVQETFKPGDYVVVTVTGVTEGGWPQIALQKAAGGWPPLANQGVGD